MAKGLLFGSDSLSGNPPLAASPSSTLATSLTTTSPFPLTTQRPTDGGGNGECKLLGSFALLIQGALGVLAISSLVWKRHRERPRRPLKIWGFDVSKQVVGSMLLHVANLMMSLLSAGQLAVKPVVGAEGNDDANGPNPCSFYLLNLAIDTTIGIPILVVLLRLLTAAFTLTPFGQPPESIQSGNYGHPPKAAWWAKQSLIYFLGLLGMKSCVLFIFNVLPWIERVGDWALRWTEGNEAIQVAFVMLIFPLIMNALQYYIIDSFIKKSATSETEVPPALDGEDDLDHAGRAGILDDSDASTVVTDDDPEAAIKDAEENDDGRAKARGTHGGSGGHGGASRSQHPPARRSYGEYDPAIDGDNEERDETQPR